MYQPRPSRLIVWAILAVLLSSSFGTLVLIGSPFSAVGSSPRTVSAGAESAHAPIALAPPASGNPDLIVDGTNKTLSPTLNGGLTSYLMGGNITVENGGVLWVYHMTVRFESTTGTWCSCAGALVHRFSFTIESGGRVVLVDSTITTDPNSLSAYGKLNLTLTGQSTLALTYNSRLAFPGNLYVSGQSNLYLNESTVTGNPPSPSAGWPQNYTSDNSFGPTVLITGKSTVVSTRGTFNGSYASPLANTSALDENFAFGGATSVPVGTGIGTTDLTLTPATPLVLDTYNAWSSATLNFLYFNPNKHPAIANGSFTLLGATVTHSLTLFPGTGVVTENLTTSFVQNTLDPVGLTGLLNAIDSPVGPTGAYLTIGGANLSGVLFNDSWISLDPAFQYNFAVSDQSTFIGIDSTVNANWVNASTVPAYASHKFLLQGGSAAYLYNSSANSYPTDAFTNVSAIVPDATSYAYIFQWVAGEVQTSTGAAVAGASLGAFPATPLSGSFPENTTGVDYAQPAWVQAHNPILYSALNAWATQQKGAAGYDLTNAQGMGYLGLLTNELTAYTLSSGIYFGEYNMSVLESAGNITGGVGEIVSQRINSPALCAWPNMNGACQAPVTLPIIAAPQLDANLQLVGPVQFDLADAAGQSPVTYTENYTVTANITVRDVNGFSIVTSLPCDCVPLVVYDSYFSANESVATFSLNDATFASENSAGEVTLQAVFQLPYQSAGPHTLWALIDPDHETTWASPLGKVLAGSFLVVGVPFQTPSGAGVVSTSMLDPCNGGTAVSGATPNTCNSITLQATVVNDGDAPAGSGTVSVQFLLGTPLGTGTQWTNVGTEAVSASLGTPGGSAVVTDPTTVLCTCFTTVQALVSFTPIQSGKAGPTPFSFLAQNPGVFYTNDYTSIRFQNVTEEQLSSSFAWTKTPNATASIGTHMGMAAVVTNAGGPGSSATYWLATFVPGKHSYWENITSPQTYPTGTVAQWTHTSITASWVLNQSVMDLAGSLANGANREFALFLHFQNGANSKTSEAYMNVTVWPAGITFQDVAFSSQTVSESYTGVWTIPGEVAFDGSGWAMLDVDFVGPQGNYSVAGSEGVASLAGARNLTAFSNLTFGVPYENDAPISAGVYEIWLTATYNGLTRWYSTGSSVTLTAPPASCSSSQWNGFLCGGSLTDLAYVIIAAIAGVAVLCVAIFFMSKSGRGRLVECGECGELIPENALACPKCGAEFESEMVRCSRCASTIPAKSQLCPECSAVLLGQQGAAPEEQQRKDYAQTIERFRAEGRKELGENFTEGAFWDWWKRQPSYLSYSAFKLQQSQGTRSGMTAPVALKPSGEDLYQQGPPSGGAGGAMGVGEQPPAPGGMIPGGGGYMVPPTTRGAQPPPTTGAAPGAAPVPGAGGANMRVCASCQREINADFLVCPFCGAATR